MVTTHERMQPLQEELQHISAQMAPHRRLLRSVSADRGTLTLQLDNLQSAWSQRLATQHAPVVRSLQHMKRA